MTDAIEAQRVGEMVTRLALIRFRERAPERAAEFMDLASRESMFIHNITVDERGQAKRVQLTVKAGAYHDDLQEALSNLTPEQEQIRAGLSNLVPCWFTPA